MTATEFIDHWIERRHYDVGDVGIKGSIFCLSQSCFFRILEHFFSTQYKK